MAFIADEYLVPQGVDNVIIASSLNLEEVNVFLEGYLVDYED